MKHLYLCAALSALTLAAHAQDLIIETEGNQFHNNFATGEIERITNFVDADGDPSIKIEILNGANYTVKSSEITGMYTLTRDDLLKQGRYANMVYAREFNSVSELQKGDLIGVFNEADYSIDEFKEVLYAGLATYNMGSLETLFTSSIEANVLKVSGANLIKRDNIRFHVVDLVYVGEDVTGRKLPLSARLLYPYSTGKKALTLTNILVDNHVTIFQRHAEPTSVISPFSLAGYCSKGALVIQPDLLGYGISDDRTQIYVDRDVNGSGVVYSLVAANQYAKIAATKADGYTLSAKATVINSGSSQGASTALAGTYYYENVLDEALAKSMPRISETHICAGVFDIRRSMDVFTHDDSLQYACKLPMLIEGAIIAHPELIRDPEGNLYHVADFFQPTVGDYVFTNNFGKTGNLWKLMDEKTMFEGMFLRYFPSEEAAGYSSLEKILASDMLIKGEDGHNKLDYDNPKMQALLPFFEHNNLANPEIWVPQSDLRIVHGTNDVIIPYLNAQELYQNMAEYMRLNGHSCVLQTLNDLPNVSIQLSSHQIACFIWIISELTDLPIEIVETIITELISSQS